jgi:hypothetical protein
MNGRFVRRSATCAVLLVAAGGAVAQLQNGRYDSGNLGGLHQAAPIELRADAVYDVGAYPSFPPELAAGEGLQETTSFCNLCHSTRYITMQPPLPAASWDAEVTKMIKAYGAPIPEASANKIRLYLQQHYTVATRKQ